MFSRTQCKSFFWCCFHMFHSSNTLVNFYECVLFISRWMLVFLLTTRNVSSPHRYDVELQNNLLFPSVCKELCCGFHICHDLVNNKGDWWRVCLWFTYEPVLLPIIFLGEEVFHISTNRGVLTNTRRCYPEEKNKKQTKLFTQLCNFQSSCTSHVLQNLSPQLDSHNTCSRLSLSLVFTENKRE